MKTKQRQFAVNRRIQNARTGLQSKNNNMLLVYVGGKKVK